MSLNLPHAMQAAKAFTLSELLIAVAILGLIVTFTLPKVLQSVEIQSNKAKFKEAIATINQLLWEGVTTGEIKIVGGGWFNSGSYILGKLSPVQLCPNNSRNQGCAPVSSIGGSDGEAGEPGAILHSGVMIFGLNDYYNDGNNFAIDVNGVAGPNTVGQDQLILWLCEVPNGCTNGAKGASITPDGADWAHSADNNALFQSLFK